jgi:hypothetical protein
VPRSIVQEQLKKVLVAGGNTILVLMQTPMIGNVSEDLVTIASAGSIFMNSKEYKVPKLHQQNLDKETNIKEIE